MILVFGGAYQGKLDFAKANFSIDTICSCGDGSEPDFGADCICDVEAFVLDCARNEKDAKEWFAARKELWADKVIIVTDVSQGVVPADRELRTFREMNGRLMVYLADQADRVIRVFCGIGKDLK